MRILKTIAISLIASTLMVLPSTAIEKRIGLSASFAQLETAGSETLKDTSVVTNHTETGNAIVPSLFIELLAGNGFGAGVDFISGTADLAGGNQNNIKSDPGTGSDSGTNAANAELDSITTYYLIKEFDSGLSFKLGYSEADLNTTETLATGSTYGNVSIDGTMMGIGYGKMSDSGFFFRSSVEYTDFDEITLTSQVADAVSGTTNKIKGDVDATVVKLSVGKSF